MEADKDSKSSIELTSLKASHSGIAPQANPEAASSAASSGTAESPSGGRPSTLSLPTNELAPPVTAGLPRTGTATTLLSESEDMDEIVSADANPSADRRTTGGACASAAAEPRERDTMLQTRRDLESNSSLDMYKPTRKKYNLTFCSVVIGICFVVTLVTCSGLLITVVTGDFARAQAERGILEQTLLHHRYLGRPYEVTTCSDAYQASRWQVFSPHQSTGHDSNLTELIERHGQLTVFILVRAGGTTYWVPSGGAPATWSWHWGSAVQLKKVCPDGVFSSVTLGGPHSASEEEVILSTRAEAGCWVVPHILNKVGSGNQALVSITSDIDVLSPPDDATTLRGKLAHLMPEFYQHGSIFDFHSCTTRLQESNGTAIVVETHLIDNDANTIQP